MVVLPPARSRALSRPRALSNWLFAVATLVFLMVVVGGITRLTESGLSITEWKPITGVLPPLSHAAWQAEFAKYQLIPEYQLINSGMTLAQYQFIYWWEWGHRLLGRLIGLAFTLPFLWFLVRRAIPRGYTLRLLALLALGGLQGAIGWWMVTSGLSVRTDVSHIRLAVHLMTAFVILAGLVWTALDLRCLARSRTFRPARLTGGAALVAGVAIVQLVYGAFVAGLNAGYVANSWPLMNGHFFPEGVAWAGAATFVDDPFLVHFIHRWWAWVAVGAFVWLARKARRADNRPASVALHIAFGTQIIIGIATVMLNMPLWLAALHQAVGTMVVVTLAWCAHAVGRRTRRM